MNVQVEVGVSPSGVLLSGKQNDGRLHQLVAVEVTDHEALEIANLIKKRVAENQITKDPSELN